jgi:hypothetical protein
MYTAKFTALKCNADVNKLMVAADLGISAVGTLVEISWDTTTEVTDDYLTMMEKKLEEMPPVDGFCFRNVKAVK